MTIEEMRQMLEAVIPKDKRECVAFNLRFGINKPISEMDDSEITRLFHMLFVEYCNRL